MRTLIFIAALLAAPAAQAQSLSNFAFMTGCWQTTPPPVLGARQTTEVWSAARDPVMFGYARTIEHGAVIAWEQTRIELQDGWPVFIAMPQGGPPVAFRMVEPGAPVKDIVQFANEAHDFPKLVQYALEGDALVGSVYGDDASSEQRFEYHRIACATP